MKTTSRYQEVLQAAATLPLQEQQQLIAALQQLTGKDEQAADVSPRLHDFHLALTAGLRGQCHVAPLSVIARRSPKVIAQLSDCVAHIDAFTSSLRCAPKDRKRLRLTVDVAFIAMAVDMIRTTRKHDPSVSEVVALAPRVSSMFERQFPGYAGSDVLSAVLLRRPLANRLNPQGK